MADPGGIEFRGVSKTYNMGEIEVRALHPLDLDISSGEFVVILGPSGSGKTTLLNLVGGIDEASTGSLRIGGVDVAGLSKNRLTEYRRTTIGFVFQFFNLIPTLTARENVQFALELVARDAERRSQEILARVGLAERVDHFPSQLSGGEQQRVAIARALCKNPPIILADEPTGELDFKTGVRILHLMREINLAERRTFILVTHNSSIGLMADRVIHLNGGRITSDERVAVPVSPLELSW
ncbi:MAG: ABC transporter ATP-binding protein [Candidatus Geothermincolia bacterium]